MYTAKQWERIRIYMSRLTFAAATNEHLTQRRMLRSVAAGAATPKLGKEVPPDIWLEALKWTEGYDAAAAQKKRLQSAS